MAGSRVAGGCICKLVIRSKAVGGGEVLWERVPRFVRDSDTLSLTLSSPFTYKHNVVSDAAAIYCNFKVG